MNKTELISAMAEKMNMEIDATKQMASVALKAFTETITEALEKGDKVQITGFGTFETSVRSERTGVNPKTLEEIVIPAKTVPKFKPGAALKDAVANA